MVHRHIHRKEFHPKAVRGWMEGGDVLATLEDPEDLIPKGEYRCTRDWYYRGDYETFLIHVEGRSRILFHVGNTLDDTEGCVLVGEDWGEWAEQPVIVSSRAGFKRFMDSLEGVDEFTLTITDET